MKIIDAISRADALLPNSYTQKDKVAWLSTLDAMVKAEVIDTHEGDVVFNGYGDETDLQTELLIPAPYDYAYLRWLEAQIAYQNGETERYSNAIALFNTTYSGYQDYYNRTHKPKSRQFLF